MRLFGYEDVRCVKVRYDEVRCEVRLQSVHMYVLGPHPPPA